jgi:hypothetical protein
LLKEKQKQQPGARASMGDEFHALFGVQVPVGFIDVAAVETMVRRKKAGKLENVKSPLAYLSSLAGKVQSPIVTSSVQLNPESQVSVKQTAGISSSVNVEPHRLSHADMANVNALWDAMTDKTAYEEKAMAKDQTGKKYPVPVELLARSIFNAEMMNQQGGQCGKRN